MVNKLMIGLLLTLLLSMTVGCARETAQPSPPPPAPIPAPAPPLEISGITTKASYQPGEEIEIELSFISKTDEPITLTPFPPEVVITRPAPYEVIRSFTAGAESKAINPGESATYTLTWDQKDQNSQQVIPRWYGIEVTVHFVKGIPPATSEPGGFTNNPARVLIQHPQGAMEKTIELNKSQTINGVSITLESIELTATEMKINAFYVPPDYLPPQSWDVKIQPYYQTDARAEYRIDDGTMKRASGFGFQFMDDGIRLFWQSSDPVPVDARELTFVISRLGDYEGPWEFRIPLDY